jgi:hypothetical protein
LLASLVVLHLGLAIGVDRWWPELRDPSYGYRLRWLARRAPGAKAPPATVIMLGSSRTAFGFRAAEVQELVQRKAGRPVTVFNFGIYGAGPITEFVTFERLRARGIGPQLLLVEVAPPYLAGQEGAPREIDRIAPSRLSLRELPFLASFQPDRQALYVNWWRTWPVPWYAHRFAIVSRVAPAWLPFQLREDTWQHVDAAGSPVPFEGGPLGPENRSQAVDSARRQYATYLTGFRLGASACQALRELLRQCREQHVRVVLVLMPEGSEFRGLYSQDAWTQVGSFVEGLGREFEAKVINAREWVGDEGFADSHHLLPQAALSFSRRLAAEAVLPLLEPGSGDTRVAKK